MDQGNHAFFPATRTLCGFVGNEDLNEHLKRVDDARVLLPSVQRAQNDVRVALSHQLPTGLLRAQLKRICSEG